MDRIQQGFTKVFIVLISIFFLVTQVSCIGAKKGKKISVSPHVELAADENCAVCGQPIRDRLRFQSQVVMGNGRVAAFDSGREMFGYLLTVKKMGYSRSQGTGSGPVAIWVKDYDSGEWVDAQEAWFLLGSSIMGPIGKDIIPFADQKGAEVVKDKNGGEISRYGDIDREKLKGLNGD